MSEAFLFWMVRPLGEFAGLGFLALVIAAFFGLVLLAYTVWWHSNNRWGLTKRARFVEEQILRGVGSRHVSRGTVYPSMHMEAGGLYNLQHWEFESAMVRLIRRGKLRSHDGFFSRPVEK